MSSQEHTNRFNSALIKYLILIYVTFLVEMNILINL